MSVLEDVLGRGRDGDAGVAADPAGTATRRGDLHAGDASVREWVARGLLATSLLTVVVAWAVLFQRVDDAATVGGVALFDLFAASVVLQGSGLAALGLASRTALLPATPSRTPGAFTATVVGLLWAATLATVGAAVLGLPRPGWLAVGLVGGVGAFLATILLREDLGATLPVTALVVPLGLAVLAGPLAPPWTAEPGWTEAVFPGSEVLPTAFVAGSVLGAWSIAKAHDGFGVQGRQRGANYLVGVSVAGTLGVLGLLVYFVVDRGLDTMLTGAHLGLGGEWTLPLVGVTVPWVDAGLPFVTNVPGGLFVEIPGVWPAIVGTVWLVVGAVLVAVPLGIGAAIFLTEYVERGRITQVVEVATNGLWSTPSIVFGLFGMAFLMPRLSGGGRSLVVGQLVLGFMLLPLVVITSREAILAVPDEYRDASAALGVSRWQTIRSVVLPAAMPGVITGVILGVGRIAGETAPLLLVFGGPPFPSSTPDVLGSFEVGLEPPFVYNEALTQAGTALPYQLYTSITAGVWRRDIYSTTEFGWGTALVLLLVVVGFYAVGVASRLYFRRKLHYE